MSFNQNKRKLREFYKRYKAKLITFEEIPKHYQDLLLKYYLTEK